MGFWKIKKAKPNQNGGVLLQFCSDLVLLG
jgi:hypothetical protein